MNSNSPNDPISQAPKSALQSMGEALVDEERHNQWHRDHPGEMCEPSMFPMDSYENIQRGYNLMEFAGGGTIQPGDSFTPKGGK